MPITKEQILAALKNAAAKLGHSPTTTEFVQISGIHNRKVLRHFPTYLTAVRAAGLEPSPVGMRVSSATLLKDWGAVVRRLGFIPTKREYLREGRHTYTSFRNRFQHWSHVPAAFYEFAQCGGLDGEWLDVVELIRKGPIPGRGKRLARYRQTNPTLCGKAEEPKVAANGSEERGLLTERALPPPLAGKRCITVFMLEVLFSGKMGCSEQFQRRALDDRPMLGAPMNLPGFAHEPVNEMGVILLFGSVAHRLGFIIELAQSAYPDCEAKMEVEPGRWQRVKIEFEYESRGFKLHGHEAKKCDVIVCWRHNWKQCPPELQVLELSRVVKQVSR